MRTAPVSLPGRCALSDQEATTVEIFVSIVSGVIIAFIFLAWITRTNLDDDPKACPGASPALDLEHCDERWRQIWGNGLDPVWNDHFGWMADGFSVIDRIEAAHPASVVRDNVVSAIEEAGGVRVTGVSGGALENWDPSETLRVMISEGMAEFDRIAALPEFTSSVMRRAQALVNDLDCLKDELAVRTGRLVQKDAAGTVVINEVADRNSRAARRIDETYPKIGYR
jgi:hypothetical protein